MSVWASVGPDISTLIYVHSGHGPSNRDARGPSIDLAYVPAEIRKGVWVRLSVGPLEEPHDGYLTVVLDRRAVTQLRDTLTDILEGPRA